MHVNHTLNLAGTFKVMPSCCIARCIVLPPCAARSIGVTSFALPGLAKSIRSLMSQTVYVLLEMVMLCDARFYSKLHNSIRFDLRRSVGVFSFFFFYPLGSRLIVLTGPNELVEDSPGNYEAFLLPLRAVVSRVVVRAICVALHYGRLGPLPSSSYPTAYDD